MTYHESARPLSPQERLDEVKAGFRSAMLQNDTLFDVLQTRLSNPDSADAALPDFGLEPMLDRHDDGTSTFGIRINRSATTPDDVVSAQVAAYDYMPFGRMNRATGDVRIDPTFEAELSAARKEKGDALGVYQAWQAGLGAMAAQFGEPLALDPLTHTFELPEHQTNQTY